MIDIQSNSVLKNKSFKSAIVLSESSKHWLFLSRQMLHIKQWETAIQITPLQGWPKHNTYWIVSQCLKDIKTS